MNLPEEAQEKLLLRATGGLEFLQYFKDGSFQIGRERYQSQLRKLYSKLFQRRVRFLNTSTSLNLLAS